MEILKKVNGKYVFDTEKVNILSTIIHDGDECTVLGISEDNIHLISEYGSEFISVEMYMTINEIAF